MISIFLLERSILGDIDTFDCTKISFFNESIEQKTLPEEGYFIK
jgi:hypothetical protein